MNSPFGILNLIPLPALDGGQMLMLFIEAVRKKPLNLKVYQMVNIFGITLFIILTIFVFVTYRDIVRLMA